MSQLPLYFRYWGKTLRGSKNKDSGPLYHLLPYHGLDVAAAGRVVLLNHVHLTQNLADDFGVMPDGLIRWITFFLSIHDIGKFSEAFQGLPFPTGVGMIRDQRHG